MTKVQLQNLSRKVGPIAQEFGMQYVALFGSRARGDHHSKSDIDLLVRFSRPTSLLKVIRVERRLSEELKQRVDLVTEGALNPLLQESILSDAQTIYEEK